MAQTPRNQSWEREPQTPFFAKQNAHRIKIDTKMHQNRFLSWPNLEQQQKIKVCKFTHSYITVQDYTCYVSPYVENNGVWCHWHETCDACLYFYIEPEWDFKAKVEGEINSFRRLCKNTNINFLPKSKVLHFTVDFVAILPVVHTMQTQTTRTWTHNPNSTT